MYEMTVDITRQRINITVVTGEYGHWSMRCLILVVFKRQTCCGEHVIKFVQTNR